jgi:preprotein translocase subunit SecE
MMESQVVDAGASRKDSLLLVVAAVLFTGGLFAFYYFDPQLATVIRLLILLAAFGAAAAIAYRTQTGRDVWDAISGARVELRKVVWPTKQESVQTTLMIAVVVLIMTLLMWLLDSGLLWGVEKLTGRGG